MIKCIAIDDEPIALDQMARYIQQTPFLELAGKFNTAMNALDFLQQTEINLMFVDINMPGLSGMEFVKSIAHPPGIIFTTAYSQYAMEGFKVDAIDYLLKPIGYPDFLKAASKAKLLIQASTVGNEDDVKSSPQFLMIKSEYKLIRITIAEIKYVEGMREYLRIHLDNQKPIMTLMSMKKLLEALPTAIFMRVHRSYIVNLNKVRVIERSRIVFDDTVFIPVSDQYKKEFQHFIDTNFLT